VKTPFGQWSSPASHARSLASSPPRVNRSIVVRPRVPSPPTGLGTNRFMRPQTPPMPVPGATESRPFNAADVADALIGAYVSMYKNGNANFGAPEPMEVLAYVDSQRPQVGQAAPDVLGFVAETKASSSETRDLGTRDDHEMEDVESAPIGIPIGENIASVSEGGAPSGAPDDAPGGAPSGAPDDAPDNAPGGAPDDALGGAPGGAPDDSPGGAPGGAPGSVPGSAANASHRGRPEGSTNFKYLNELKQWISEQDVNQRPADIANKAEIELKTIMIEKEQKSLYQLIEEAKPGASRRTWLVATIRSALEKLKKSRNTNDASGVAAPSSPGGDAAPAAPEAPDADMAEGNQGAAVPSVAADADTANGDQGASMPPVIPEADMTDGGEGASAAPEAPEADMVEGTPAAPQVADTLMPEEADEVRTYDLIEVSPEYAGNVLSDTEMLIKVMEELDMIPKYAVKEYFKTVRSINMVDEWLKRRFYTILQRIEKLDTEPDAPGNRVRLSDIKDPVSLQNFKENNPYFNCFPKKKDALKANAYSLWFHPLLSSIKTYIERPEWIYQSFKAWIDTNIDIVDGIEVSSISTFIVQLENFLSDSKDASPKIKDKSELIDELMDLLYQLNLVQYHKERDHYSEDIVKLWFPDDQREQDKALSRLKPIEDSTEDSLITLINKLGNDNTELLYDNDKLQFKNEGVVRTKPMFGDMIDALNDAKFYKTPVMEREPAKTALQIKKIMNRLSDKLDLGISGWADQAARLTQRIVTRVDEDILKRNPVDQFERVQAAYNEKYCYVPSGRTLIDTKRQGGSAVQNKSAENANLAYSKNRRSVLYNWATGTGKTSAIWCEIFAAIANDVEHAYVSLIRWGTAQDIFSNIYEAQSGNHIRDIARRVFGDTFSIEVQPSVTAYYKNNTKSMQSGKELRVWTDDQKMVISFDVKINEKNIRVYLSRAIDWASMTVPDDVINKNDDVKELRRYEWQGNMLEEVIKPIAENERRIFIVDEAHEIRINDAVANFSRRRVSRGDVPYFEYLHEDDQWKKEAPESWGKQSNCLLSLIRGDITPVSFENMKESNQVLRCAYLTATPIAQHWGDFIDFLSSMYAVTHDNDDLKTLCKEYAGDKGLREDFAKQLTENVQEPVKLAMKETKSVNLNTKVKALKSGRSVIMEMLNRFEIDVSLDLFSTVDMPYTNYSMTNTGIGYNGLTLTQNEPIKVTLDVHLSRFHALMETGDIWAFGKPNLKEWMDLFYESHEDAEMTEKNAVVEDEITVDESVDEMVFGAPTKRPADTSAENIPKKQKKEVPSGLKVDMKKRFTCAVYCFKDTSGQTIPFPIFYGSGYTKDGEFNYGHNFHKSLFDIEHKMFDSFKDVSVNLNPQKTLRNTDDAIKPIFLNGELDKEVLLLRHIYAFVFPGERWTNPSNMEVYRQLWKRVVREDKWGFKEDVIHCVAPKLNMIAKAVQENTLSPSMTFFLINGFGGSDHFAMLLDALEKPIKLIKATKQATDAIRASQNLYQERCVIMNKDATATNRDSLTNEDTGLFNDDRNAHGGIIRCIIFVAGSAASITLRNVLVCHYPIDDFYILRYVQSLGRIARRSAFNQKQQTKLKLFGFTATKEEPQGHDLVREENDPTVPETVDQVNDIFTYKDGTLLVPFATTGEARTPGQYNMIQRIPVCSYITYRAELAEIQGIPDSWKTSIDDRIGELSLQASSIYTIIQLALATLSQNCTDNSDHFARITGNENFVNVCAAVQNVNISEVERDIEKRAIDISIKKMKKVMNTPESVPFKLKQWIAGHNDYFNKWRSGQSVIMEARKDLGKSVLTDKWTKRQAIIILKVVAEEGQLTENSKGEFKKVGEARTKPKNESPASAAERNIIQNWIENNLTFFQGKGDTALHTVQAIRNYQTSQNQKPLAAKWTAELVADILRSNESLEETNAKTKLFKLK